MKLTCIRCRAEYETGADAPLMRCGEITTDGICAGLLVEVLDVTEMAG